MANKADQYQAPALEKGLDILEYLSLQAVPLSQTEIARGLQKNNTEIYRMLVCLEERGYIIRNSSSGKYRLSLKLYSLSHRHSPVDEIRKIARHPMQNLSEKTNQSCHMGSIYRDRLIVIYQSKSPGPIALSIEEGGFFPLISTTSGRLLLAFMPKIERKKLLDRMERFQKYSPEKQTEMLNLFDTIRKEGFYCAESEITEGVTDIAVPLDSVNSDIPLSLAVSMLTNHLGNMISMEEIIDEAQRAADKILTLLGNK
jgi:DNA-binding IclR family transcriptional regulator